MGLLINVYKTAAFGDCTNGGISSQFDTLCVVNVEGPFNPTNDAPAVMLVKGATPGIARIVPAHVVGDACFPAKGWFMMGGNYGATSDSRFVRAVEAITGARFYGAVPIHDRQE